MLKKTKLQFVLHARCFIKRREILVAILAALSPPLR